MQRPEFGGRKLVIELLDEDEYLPKFVTRNKKEWGL